jgi:hypothetical protein
MPRAIFGKPYATFQPRCKNCLVGRPYDGFGSANYGASTDTGNCEVEIMPIGPYLELSIELTATDVGGGQYQIDATLSIVNKLSTDYLWIESLNTDFTPNVTFSPTRIYATPSTNATPDTQMTGTVGTFSAGTYTLEGDVYVDDDPGNPVELQGIRSNIATAEITVP